MSTNLREQIRLQKLENEGKKLELEIAQQPGKFLGFTAGEWIQLAHTSGGCLVSLPITGLLIMVLIHPELMETYDQLIASLVTGAVAFYLGRKSK
ncbi:MAG: hypothetical protein ACPGWR_09250 [Ardenticatenaceae bacterium]